MKNNVRIALVFWGLAALILLALCPLKNSDNLYRSVIRLHVIANSDTEKDQEVKLAVRDKVLCYAKENLALMPDAAYAKKELEGHLDGIQRVAEEELALLGEERSVSVLLSEEYYPTRSYEAIALPAGDYLSLQIKIGSGEGKNWWCVLFPPMCLESALGPEEALIDTGMEEENVKTLVREGKGYRIRFRVLEMWSGAKEKLKKLF